MYNLILLYLNQIDNTYYKNSHKESEFWIDGKIGFYRLTHKIKFLINKEIDYNYRHVEIYKNFGSYVDIYNINGRIYNEYKIPLKLSTNHWFCKFI